MSLSVVRYDDDGKRTRVALEPAARSRRFVVVDADRNRIGVADLSTGTLVAYASEARAFDLARLLNVLDPDAGQLAALLGDGKRGAPLLRTIELRHDSVCHRCGQGIKAGRRARWNTETRLVRHLRTCPREVIVNARKRRRSP